MRSSRRCSPDLRLAGLIGAVVLVLATVLTGCAAAATPAASPSGAAITVSGAWIRPPSGPDLPAAGYMVITSGGPADALTKVTSSAAGKVEVHETTTMSGMTGMQPIAKLEIPAGGSVELKSGSYHLMLMELASTLKVGDSVQLVLTFEKAGQVTVTAEVKNG